MSQSIKDEVEMPGARLTHGFLLRVKQPNGDAMLCNFCNTEKQPNEFYLSKRTKCKECAKSAMRRNRIENLSHYRAYDEARANSPSNISKRRDSAKRWKENNPEGRDAVLIANRAMRKGVLIRQPCFVCGERKAEAHHPAYSLPLAVTFLCKKCHTRLHREHRAYCQPQSL